MKKLSLAVAFFAVFAFTAFSQVPKEIKGGILNGKATSLPKPEYPESAKAAGLEGVVYVNVVIDEGGNVVSAIADDQVRKVYKPGKDGEKVEEEQPAADIILRDAAERAAWNARFSPTLLSGVPVKVTGTIVYNFVASKGDEGHPEDSASATLKPITGGILNSKAISLPSPTYPPAAKAVRAEGAVNVKVTVDEAGNVISAAAVSGHPLLRAASVSAAREAKFSPVMLSGQAVKFTGVLVYNFVAPSMEN
jgi:TonB family protein